MYANIGYLQIRASSLFSLLQDSATTVVQRAITRSSVTFQTGLERPALQGVESSRVEEDLVKFWNWMTSFKQNVSSLAFLKRTYPYLGKIRYFEDIHMTWIAGGHSVLDATGLEKEASKNFELPLNQLQSVEAPSISWVVVFAILNSLTVLSNRRSFMSETILPVLSATPKYYLRAEGLFINILASNQPGALPWREQLVASMRSMNVEEMGDQMRRDPEIPTFASTALDTEIAHLSMHEEEIGDEIFKDPGTPTSASGAKPRDQIVKEPGTPTPLSRVSSAKVIRPSVTPGTVPATATIVTTPGTASPLRQIRTSSPASTATAPPRAASPARLMRTSPAVASVTAPPRNASPARQSRTSVNIPSVTAPPQTTSLARQTRVSSVGTSDNAPPRTASPSRQTRKSSGAPSVTAPPRTASPSRQPKTSPTATTGTAALRPAPPSAKMSKISGFTPQNGIGGEKVLRGLSPARARSGSMDNAASRGYLPPRAGPSVENPKSSSVIVPFPPAYVKSVKLALTSLKASPRPSPSSSPRADPSAQNSRASGVIVPFPLAAMKSMPKPSVTSVKSSPRSASPSVRQAPQSASPSVKAPARSASPSVRAPARPTLPSIKTISQAASPSARSTSRPPSPSPAARKSLVASPRQPPSPSTRGFESSSTQLSTLNGSAIGLSSSLRAGSNVGKPSASTNSVAASPSPETSARSTPSPSSSSQSFLKSKVNSLAPLKQKAVQLSGKSLQSFSSGRSDPSLDVHPDSEGATAARSGVQEVSIQRLWIASFKENSGLLKATEVISSEVLPANPMALDTKKRCGWITSQSDNVHIAYHDNEWGVPVYDDKLFFELIVLQGAHAELSWPTILARRNNFRAVFANFDPAIVANFDEKKKLSLIADSSICFPEAKVRGAVDNAAHVLKIIEEYGSLSKFLWSYVNHKPIVSRYKLGKQVPVKTPKSEALSKELLRRGFRFVGPTTMYSVMQATGLVCDHLVTCYRYQETSVVNLPVTDREEEKVTDSWQRISLPVWREASTFEPRLGAVDGYPHEFRRASANASDPVWAELPIIEEAKEDDL